MGKRGSSIFDAIEELETQDRLADGKRRKKSQADTKRAVEAQHQTKIYHHLVESRILLQRALRSPPNHEDQNQNATSTSSSTLFRDTCNTLLEGLLQARNSLSRQADSSTTEKSRTKYRELVSSLSPNRLQRTLQTEYEEHREGWKQVLNARHKSLRLHSGVTAKSQFKVMDSSFWQQVEATIEYEEIRDTDMSRTGYLNGNDVGLIEFDDTKVYQQLLKDFVANSANAAVAGSADVAERDRASRQRNTGKKDVDRRASKGRRIRYKEIPKLVNFTFPLTRPVTSNLDQDAYFQSLFGGVASQGRKM